jgi:16S rRNA (cytidine1402-2'-O)-methyltransferase
MSIPPGTLAIVATPLGNLGDITYRGVEVLGEVDGVYAEDTRVSQKLLRHYGIERPLKSFRQSPNRDLVELTVQEILQRLKEGESLAYITDAGTPGVSDPGSYLVHRVREAGFSVTPIPGPSAGVALVSATGIPAIRTLNVGFLPKKKGRQTLMKKMEDALESGLADALVIYESPERLLKTIGELCEWTIPELHISVGRELTKIHEEIVRGPAEEVHLHFKKKPKIRGEAVMVVYQPKKQNNEGEE